MPKNPEIKKVLMIGSGPIIIGQAAEFDYAGTQACRSLKEEGIEVVLLNSNPATIMTDKDIADKVYIEPLTVEVVEQLILKEQPDSVLPTLGGQAGLNLAMELEERGFLKEHNVRLIGTTAETIKKAEDRQEFKDTMEKIGEPVAASKVVHTVPEGVEFTQTIGYPVVLRPAYTLGGSGGGIAHNYQELVEILENGLRLSRVGEVLVERCIAGWKEIEYEVMRDSAGNVHHGLQYGEHRSGRRTHRRQYRSGTVPDAGRQGVSDAPYVCIEHHQRAEDHRRLQRAVCSESGQLRVLRHRSKSACQPFLCTGFQGDGLSDREGSGEDCAWLHLG